MPPHCRRHVDRLDRAEQYNSPILQKHRQGADQNDADTDRCFYAQWRRDRAPGGVTKRRGVVVVACGGNGRTGTRGF